MEKKLLFVCTGNTCRSSMAEAIALKIISENKDEFGNIWVTSAGTHALEGVQASDYAIKIADEEGINLRDFRSKQINKELINAADVILTMTNSHKQQILNIAPEVQDKVFLLKEYINDFEQKEDHYEKAKNLYRRIEQKQQNFFEKHKDVLQNLEKKKKELEQELDQIITEIGNWEAELYQETLEERLELQKIEKEIQGLEITDPFGQPLEVYRKCYEELYSAINKALHKLVNNV